MWSSLSLQSNSRCLSSSNHYTGVYENFDCRDFNTHTDRKTYQNINSDKTLPLQIKPLKIISFFSITHYTYMSKASMANSYFLLNNLSCFYFLLWKKKKKF